MLLRRARPAPSRPYGEGPSTAAGRHTIRVEHFELDGWAVLEVTLVPAP